MGEKIKDQELPDTRRLCKVAIHTSMIGEQLYFYNQATVIDVVKCPEFWDTGTIHLLIHSLMLEPIPYGRKIPTLEVIMNNEKQSIRFVTREQAEKELEASQKALEARDKKKKNGKGNK